MSLTLDHITASFRDGPDIRTVLDDVSLAIEPGEVVALTGTSGSGKSTLLAIAGLLRRPDSGSVSIAGTDGTALNRKGATRLRGEEVGLVFQSSNLFPSLTALEQVELVAHIAGRLNGAAKARARELLVEVGLEAQLNNRPAQLSGGERQRVGIARALMNEPSVLLADEPTAALDDQRGRAIMDLLVTEGLQRGVATLIVTHNPDQVNGATRWVDLAAGRVTARSAAGIV